MEPLQRKGLVSRFKKEIKKLRDYNRIAHIDKIARRYFLMNTFDGLMTVFGIVLGSIFSGSGSPKFIIAVGFGAAIAMAVSGVWGAYTAEHTERMKELREIERATLSKLGNTSIGRAFRMASIVVAIIDGISPFLATVIVLMPFFFSGLSMKMMHIISIATAFAILALLGVFTAKISKERLFLAIAKMLLAGIVCAILTALVI